MENMPDHDRARCAALVADPFTPVLEVARAWLQLGNLRGVLISLKRARLEQSGDAKPVAVLARQALAMLETADGGVPGDSRLREAFATMVPEQAEVLPDDGAAGNPQASLGHRFQVAYKQWVEACRHGGKGRMPTDEQCYTWAKAHNDGHPLPALETWTRYVRAARRTVGQSKNTPRAGRKHGRSVVG